LAFCPSPLSPEKVEKHQHGNDDGSSDCSADTTENNRPGRLGILIFMSMIW
jgi:hypothetical protein